MIFQPLSLIIAIPNAIIDTVSVLGSILKKAISIGFHRNSKQIEGIAKEQIAEAQFDSLSTTVRKEFSALKMRFRPEEIDPKMMMELALKSAPNKEAYYQILAQDGAYFTFENGYILMPSDHFVSPIYQVKKTIQYPNGIKAIVVVSEDSTEPPLLVFRGTDARNLHNLIDDITPHIAELNTAKYDDQLRHELINLHGEYGRIHIIGHSYGGTVAQRLTAKYPELINRCTYHNAPAAGEKVAYEFERTLRMRPRIQRPEVWEYRHAKDLASLLGGKPLPADPGRNYTMGKITDTMPHIDSHSFNTLSTGADKYADHPLPPRLQVTQRRLEGCRRGVGRLVVPFYKYMVY